uniref:proteasome assembly chaperone 1 n=1 Tax=Doryrhamphus excisus TaxID=161450 RepID=UPI0025ADC541|nr:proteasome assembly chaperone 1 [Doryrhamphus excisus]
MATFFGEVLSVYSRAVEDDEEEFDEYDEDAQIRRELEEKREVHLHWVTDVSDALQAGNKLQCSQLLLAVGHNAARFLSVYVLTSAKWDVVGHASMWNERNRAGTGQSADQSGCVFYRHKDDPSVIICQLTCYVAEDQQFQWTEKVFDSLQKRELNVTVLSDSFMAEYRTADYLCGSSAPFLRSLHTGSFTGPHVCRSLEQPNILSGLPAAVLNHCQVHRIAAVVYQCFSDVIGPDSVTMETFKPTLTKLGKSVHLDPSPSSDVVRKFVRTSDLQSNLYI